MSKVKIGLTTDFRPSFRIFIIFLKLFTIHYLWFPIFQVKKPPQKQVTLLSSGKELIRRKHVPYSNLTFLFIMYKSMINKVFFININIQTGLNAYQLIIIDSKINNHIRF
jgi:hypothetical protein